MEAITSNRLFTPQKGRRPSPVRPSRPDPRKIAVAPIIRGASSQRMNALDEIVKMAGAKPENWKKPKFGDFEYWLAHNCQWITDAELQADVDFYNANRERALETSHRFSKTRFTWGEQPRHEVPQDNGEYIPSVNMRLIRDRNLTDSARRIAMFIMRHTYQDNRKDRFIGMTVSFVMNGLALSRRTVQRSLTLLETLGYFRCEVAKGNRSRMCIGLIIHLLEPLFPQHHKKKWPKKRGNPEASSVPQKHSRYTNLICGVATKNKVQRLTWAIKCMNGVARSASNAFSMRNPSQIPECRGYKTVACGTLMHPKLRAMEAALL